MPERRDYNGAERYEFAAPVLFDWRDLGSSFDAGAAPGFVKPGTVTLEGPSDPRAYSELILSCRHRRSAIEIIPERKLEVKVVY